MRTINGHSIILLVALAALLAVYARPENVRRQDAIDISVLIRAAIRNGKGAQIFLSDYTHVQTITRRSVDKKGKVKEASETWEAYIPSLKHRNKPARWVRIKIKENGVPLPPDKVEKERIKAGERLAKAEAESQKLAAKTAEEKDEESLPDAKGAYFTMTIRRPLRSAQQLDVKTLLLHCAFDAPQREMIGGRETVALKFRPQPEARLSEAEEFISQLTGTIWIDVADSILVRAVGWPVKAQTPAGKPAILYESIRVTGDKWLPHKIVLNGLDYKDVFKGLGEEIEVVLDEYQRFQTEGSEGRVAAPRPRQ